MTTTHPFESAGLGKAPFRFVGMVEQDMRYGERILNREEYQRTGIALTTAPGGSCAYCGTYIMRMFGIESADGRRFHVGCECVEKTADKRDPMRVAVNAARRAVERKRREARNAERIAAGQALLSNADVRAKLAAQPHPYERNAAEGETLLTSYERRWERSGVAGRLRIAKELQTMVESA